MPQADMNFLEEGWDLLNQSKPKSAVASAATKQARIRRRNRMITSCLECRRRKLKCDKLVCPESAIESLVYVQLTMTAPMHQLLQVRAGLQLPGADAGLGVPNEVDRDQREDGLSRARIRARCRKEKGAAYTEKAVAKKIIRGPSRRK